MGRYGEQLRRMTIETRSPDRTVRLRYSGDGTVELDLAPGCLARHTETSLAGQVRAVIRVAIAAQGQGRQQAWRATAEERGENVDEPGGESTTIRPATPFGRYLEANRSLTAGGTSPSGQVRVERDDNGEVVVRIRAGTLANATERSLAAEITQAMVVALADHQRRNRDLIRQFLGADIERIIFGGGQ